MWGGAEKGRSTPFFPDGGETGSSKEEIGVFQQSRWDVTRSGEGGMTLVSSQLPTCLGLGFSFPSLGGKYLLLFIFIFVGFFFLGHTQLAWMTPYELLGIERRSASYKASAAQPVSSLSPGEDSSLLASQSLSESRSCRGNLRTSSQS